MWPLLGIRLWNALRNVKLLWLRVLEYAQEAVESIDSASPTTTPAYKSSFGGIDPDIVTSSIQRIAVGLKSH